jgi:hypothetical protein
MFWMSRVLDDLEEIAIAMDSANVFERTGTSAIETAWVLSVLFPRSDSFQAHFMLPAVAKVVLVERERDAS